MADNEDLADWLPEIIPPADKLYMRIHRSYAPEVRVKLKRLSSWVNGLSLS